jgi:hypothetical protein
MPLATITDGGQEIVINALNVTGLDGKLDTWLHVCLGVLLALPALMPLVIIFLFKNRLLQIRLCVSEIVLQLGALIFIGIYCYRLCAAIPEVAPDAERHFMLNFASLAPIVAIILVGLAIRGIAKDEALVRSLDRIR